MYISEVQVIRDRVSKQLVELKWLSVKLQWGKRKIKNKSNNFYDMI